MLKHSGMCELDYKRNRKMLSRTLEMQTPGLKTNLYALTTLDKFRTFLSMQIIF
jgi:hypothetical protein